MVGFVRVDMFEFDSLFVWLVGRLFHFSLSDDGRWMDENKVISFGLTCGVNCEI